VVPEAVAIVDLGADRVVQQGPIYEVILGTPGGPAWGLMTLNTDAIGVVLEGVLGGGDSGGASGLGADLTLAQSALVGRVTRALADDFAEAVRAEVGIGLLVEVQHSVARGDEREANFSDGLSVDCAFDGLAGGARITIAIGAEALDNLKTEILKHASGEAPDSRQTTVQKLKDAMMQTWKNLDKNPASVAWAENCWKRLLPYFGAMKAHTVSSAAIRGYVEARKSENAANGTINRELSVLSSAFTIGYEETPRRVAGRDLELGIHARFHRALAQEIGAEGVDGADPCFLELGERVHQTLPQGRWAVRVEAGLLDSHAKP